MKWLKKGWLVSWVDVDGEKYVGKIVGLNGLFGKKGRERGWMVVDVEVVSGKGWWVKYELGSVKMVVLAKGKFWVSEGWGKGWKKVV